MLQLEHNQGQNQELQETLSKDLDDWMDYSIAQ